MLGSQLIFICKKISHENTLQCKYKYPLTYFSSAPHLRWLPWHKNNTVYCPGVRRKRLSSWGRGSDEVFWNPKKGSNSQHEIKTILRRKSDLFKKHVRRMPENFRSSSFFLSCSRVKDEKILSPHSLSLLYVCVQSPNFIVDSKSC